jgi:hypothetical protein
MAQIKKKPKNTKPIDSPIFHIRFSFISPPCDTHPLRVCDYSLSYFGPALNAKDPYLVGRHFAGRRADD